MSESKCGKEFEQGRVPIVRHSRWRSFSVIFAIVLTTLLSLAQNVQRKVQDASQSPPTTAAADSYEALVIGNNDYRYLGKLLTAVNDADAVAKVLHDRFGFKIKVLHNATRDDIITAMVEYRRTLTENSNLLIYYAGHGHNDKDVDEAYWLPVDADKDNNENWISADDITRDVRAIHSRHVLIISDSCYSGTLTRDANASIRLGDNTAVLARMLRLKSRTLMASGGDEPVADSGGGAGHSVFAGAILLGLRELQGSQFTADALFQAIRPRVAGRSEQMPKYDYIRNSGHDDGDFVFSPPGVKVITGVGGAGVSGSGEESGDLESVAERVDTPLKPPANVAPSFDPEKERSAIQDLLQLYQDAYDQRDASVLWKIWPGAATKTKQAVEASFANAAAIRMNLQMGIPNIGQDQTSATVKGSFSQMYTPKNGNPQPRSGDIGFTLQKKNGLWAIVDIK